MTGLNQHVTRLCKEAIDFPLDVRRDHLLGTATIRAGQLRGGAEQSTDQRAFRIDLAPIDAQMRAAQVGERSVVLCFALNR